MTQIRFIDLVNMAKGLMDENQQPSVTQELGRLFPGTRGGWRGGESIEFLTFDAGKSLLQKLIQIILVVQRGIPQNG